MLKVKFGFFKGTQNMSKETECYFETVEDAKASVELTDALFGTQVVSTESGKAIRLKTDGDFDGMDIRPLLVEE